MTEEKKSDLQIRLARIRHEGEERDAQRRAEKLGLPYANLGKAPISIEAMKLIPEAEAKDARVASIEMKPGKLAVAVYDPNAPAAKRVISGLKAKHYEVSLFVVSMGSLEQAWNFYKFIPEAAKEITGKVEIEKKRFEELLGKLTTFQKVQQEIKIIDFKKATTTDLFEIILAGALANKASDLHFEAEEKGVKIRFRLDGLLHDIFGDLPLKNYVSLVSRIKLLSGLKINIHGEPQDGRFTIGLFSKEIEMRVSIIPSEFGETIVMRVLDPSAILVDLPDLGLREDDLAIVERELQKPNGLILNTGPTGSGKTTTLYAFLRRIVNPEIKIITIEDPIEYRISGIEQTQVDPDVGYTFADGLRSILRQDPDAILVGEIRDKETADIAMQASLTGHMVFSTLHTNDAIGAVPRLTDLGVKPSTIGPALTLVIAQRLVRKLCPKCKTKISLTPTLKGKVKKFIDALPERVKRDAFAFPMLYKPKGCITCNNFGYKGRVGIFEFLEAGSELEEVILKEVSEVSLRKLAEREHMVSLQEDGVLKALLGVTTLEEVERITGPVVW